MIENFIYNRNIFEESAKNQHIYIKIHKIIKFYFVFQLDKSLKIDLIIIIARKRFCLNDLLNIVNY